MAVTCYKNYGTPLNCTGVPVTCTGKSQALENTTRCCVFLPLSRGADLLSAVFWFWHPRFSDRQLADADGVISLVASEKCSRLGFGSSRMLLSWQ